MIQSSPPPKKIQTHISHTLAGCLDEFPTYSMTTSNDTKAPCIWFTKQSCCCSLRIMKRTYQYTSEFGNLAAGSFACWSFAILHELLKIQQDWQKILKRAQLLILIGRTRKNRKTWRAILPINLNVYHLNIPQEARDVHFNILGKKKEFNWYSTAKTCILALHFRSKGGSHCY